MSVYRVEFTAKGYIELAAPNPDAAYERAMDIVDGMSNKAFADIFADNVEAEEVECVEEEMNPHDYYLDIG